MICMYLEIHPRGWGGEETSEWGCLGSPQGAGERLASKWTSALGVGSVSAGCGVAAGRALKKWEKLNKQTKQTTPPKK